MGVKVRQYDKGNTYFFDINWKGTRIKIPTKNDLATSEAAATILEAKLKTGEINIEQIRHSNQKEQMPTFNELSKDWLVLHQDEWKPATLASYRFNLKKHILPKFGKIKVNEITRSMIKRFLDEKMLKGAAPAFVTLLKAPINGILSLAVDYELIDHNPGKDISIKKSKNEGDKINPLKEDEIPLLLDASKTLFDGWYYFPILCALRTGIRFGELIALRWDDIDFENRVISINQIWYRGQFGLPKSGKKRKVDATPELVAALNDLHSRQRKLSFKMGTGGQSFDFVFANRKGNLLDLCSFNNALQRCLKKAGLGKIRVHDLRHTYATIRIMRGHNIADVSNQLGHSNIGITTKCYFHFIPSQYKSEVDALDTPPIPAKTPRQTAFKNVKTSGKRTGNSGPIKIS